MDGGSGDRSDNGGNGGLDEVIEEGDEGEYCSYGELSSENDRVRLWQGTSDLPMWMSSRQTSRKAMSRLHLLQTPALRNSST